ncbi:glycine reductase [Ligilactobacillus agilis]|uniref:glycine reductase n=1 Tax=Ligilactobacillus agilis TaxID=1601 RepID=UPI00242AF5F0|nr:glycine reductase [Ligilactobacillus agilis]
MEEINKTKKYRIESVYYEFSGREVTDNYSEQASIKIIDFISDWSDINFDKTDGYIYFDDLEKELVPPELTPADRKRFIEYLEKEIEVVNK